MDIKNLIPSVDTVEVELRNPMNEEPLKNDDGSVMTITMWLPHSKTYKEVRHSQTDRRIKQSRKKNAATITAEDIDNETVELLVKTTASWNITYDSKKVKFSEEKADEIYKLASWIPEQLFEGVAEAEVFTKN